MNTFDQLAPFIQDYIYRNRWEELREVQVAACDVIFNTDSNLLLSTPTASGKTEAAFLPIITELYQNPSSSVGILYIAPLKALINDQFVRVEELLKEAHIPVTKWHGDASRTAKNKLVKHPRGVLQITPESLEAMLMRRKQQAIALFSDLRFIIIDEVHAFLASDRGIQLSSLLERIQTLTGTIPRRVGLSATLGDIPAAEEWLNCGSHRTCITPEFSEKRRKAQLMMTHFYTNLSNLDDDSWNPYMESLYKLTKGKKSILFSNSREEVEFNMNRLKLLAAKKKERDAYFVHHGNIAADSREYAEFQMKNSDLPLVTGATVTLELGIDLGDLERIVQTGSPHSVASLAQKLGRSGRRSGISQMCFVFREDMPKKQDAFYRRINWEFVKCIALIELYRENWIEPLRTDRLPYNVLFHQTISALYAYGDTAPALLAQKMLSEKTFRHICQEDFKLLLKHMLQTGILEQTEEGKLLIEPEGEWLANSFDFFSIFETPVEYSVREGGQEIGSLHEVIPVGERFALSGKTWEVLEVDRNKKALYVKLVGGISSISWKANLEFNISTKVLQKMQEVLNSGETYGYLHPNSALARLVEIRKTIAKTKALEADPFPIAPGCFGLMPWLGTRALNALCFALPLWGCGVDVQNSDWVTLVVHAKSEAALLKAIEEIKAAQLKPSELALPKEIPPIGKYGDYVPQELVRKQFLDKYVDIGEMQKELAMTCKP